MKWAVALFAFGSLGLALLCVVMPLSEPHRKNLTKRDFQRVVALAPSMSETIDALGQAHRLVGVTTHCHGANLDPLPKIGSFAEPNFEAIMALEPDLVVAVPHVMAQPILRRLKEHHIEVFAQQPDSLHDIEVITTKLAEMFNVIERGALLNHQIHLAINYAKEKLSLLSHHAKTILIAVSVAPLVAAGRNTFPSEILENAGFHNQAQDKTVPWPVWPLEHLLHTPPYWVILTDGEQLHDFRRMTASLGIKPGHFRLLIPQRPIFRSPSPLIIDDIYHLVNILPKSL